MRTMSKGVAALFSWDLFVTPSTLFPYDCCCFFLPFLGLLGVFLFSLSNGYYVISFRLYDNDCIDDYHDDDDDDDEDDEDDEDEDDDAEDDDEDDDDG